jgi:hypothetical protein
MSPYSESTAIAEVVIIPNGNNNFYDKIHKSLLLSGNSLTPVRLRVWLEHGDENFFSANAMITLSNQFVALCDEEKLSEKLSATITDLLGKMTSSLLELQTVLVCDKSSHTVITAFCSANKIKKEDYFPEQCEAFDELYSICYWSRYRYNLFTKYRKRGYEM